MLIRYYINFISKTGEDRIELLENQLKTNCNIFNYNIFNYNI